MNKECFTYLQKLKRVRTYRDKDIYNNVSNRRNEKKMRKSDRKREIEAGRER